MSSVASKNLFELLGNDAEGDEQLPVIPVEKSQPRVGKREGTGEAPVRDATNRGKTGGRGGRKDEPKSANERAFRDRDAGREGNRGKPIDDGLRTDRHSNTLEGGRIQRGGRYDGRGGRGGAGGRGGRGGKDDRHSRTGIADHPKQEAKGWGEETGTGEWDDEKAGEAIAKADEKDAAIEADSTKPVDANGEPIPEEPEDKTKSYADYLAEQAEKKLKLGGTLAARKANEGGKEPKGTAVTRDEEDFFVGSGGKAGRQRERKAKDNQLLLDHDLIARDSGRPERGGRGGRGGRRGDGPREGGRGGRGGRGGDRERAPRGEGRGGRGGAGRAGPTPNLSDQSAFPSLGA